MCGFTVVPALPDALKSLRELANNLWWTWNPDAFQLFRRPDIDLWEEVYHNPVRLLGRVDQRRLEQAAGDAGYMAHLNSVLMSLHDYMTATRGLVNTIAILKASPSPISARIRPARMPADLLRRPWHAGRRPSSRRQRPRRAPLGGGPVLPTGLFPPAADRDGWQIEEYPRTTTSTDARPGGER